ncbi:ParM/StbA family protein [Sulfobacillus sp. hq2]|uniref:ParM/StbA family protein n=1 Tax=Sulfobacillus sp. hq2 TaxID=2039167 RepID=UPI000CD26C80|nr:ParM/StbA family protein [Sulfobacillus sp. hq2]POB12308.1 hypothetical protein CO251_00125 [Sulfobacillus sp. hq2]
MMSENRVAVDCGHGCVKALTDHGQRLLGPSLIVPVVEGAETWGTLDAVKPDVVQWAGHEANHYLVGQDAAPHAASLFSRDKAADVLTRDLTMIAVGRLLATSGRVRLAVGVPLAWYLQARREIPEAWAGIVTVNGQTLTIAQVAVWPQGVAALLAVLPPTASPGLYALADVGYRTTDYLIVEVTRAGHPQLISEWSGTVEVGAYHALVEVARQVEQRWQVTYAPHELAQRTEITVRGQEVSIEALQRAAQARNRQNVMGRLQTAWAPILPRLSALLVVGGGAENWRGETLGTMPVTVATDAQWANAQGYLLAMPQ